MSEAAAEEPPRPTTTQMATVREIDAVITPEGWKSVCLVKMGLWQVIVPVGMFEKGKRVVHVEVDACIPAELLGQVPPSKIKIYNGVKAMRVVASKVGEHISQGYLITPDGLGALDLGEEVSEKFGIKKYVPPSMVFHGPVMKGFPVDLVPETGLKRLQNIWDKYADANLTYEVTEKLDGSSMTVFILNGEERVCSHHREIVYHEKDVMWKVARPVLDAIRKYGCEEFAFQGELIGPKINDGRYKIDQHGFYVFDLYVLKDKRYLDPEERMEIMEKMERSVRHCPVMQASVDLKRKFDEFFVSTSSKGSWSTEELFWNDLCVNAVGKSAINPDVEREGLVFKSYGLKRVTFKVISGTFLVEEAAGSKKEQQAHRKAKNKKRHGLVPVVMIGGEEGHEGVKEEEGGSGLVNEAP